MVELRLTLVTGAIKAPLDISRRYAARPEDAGTVSGLALLSTSGDHKHYVLRNAAGKPLCSKDLTSLAPHARLEVWARFAVPAAAGEGLHVVVPGAGVPVAVPPS